MKEFALFKVLLLLLVLMISETLTAQEKGKVLIYFSPPTAIVYIDTMHYVSQKSPLLLPVGKHIVKAWAPTKQLFMDTISVGKNGIVILAKTLKPTQAYANYCSEKRSYKLKMVLERYLPSAFILAYTGYYLSADNKFKNEISTNYNQALAEKALYDKSIVPEDIKGYEAAFQDNQKKYESALKSRSTGRNVALVVIPVSALCAGFFMVKSFKLIKPTYSETPLLTLNSIYVYPGQANTVQAGINLTFGR